MIRSYLDLDECLQGQISGKEVAWLLLELERIAKLAAEKKIRVERRNDGLALVAYGTSGALMVGRITNESQRSHEIEAGAALFGPMEQASDKERGLFEDALRMHMGWPIQGDLDEFCRHKQSPAMYQRPIVERAWEAWVHGFWWAWCMHNPVIEQRVESDIAEPEPEPEPVPVLTSNPAPEIEDDLPWRRPL